MNSKFTYWPKKHITTEAQLSIKKMMMYVKIGDSSTTNRFYFAGKLGKTTNRFIAKVGNDLLKKEIKIDGELNTENKKVLVNMVAKPSGHVVEFVAYPRWNALENGYYMQLSHLNSSSHVKGHLYSLSMKRESALKLSGVLMKRSFSLRASHYVLGRGKRVELVAEGFGNNASMSFEYSAKRWANKNVEFSAALNNKRIKTGVFLKGNGIGAYVNDKTMEVETSYKNEEKSKGLVVLLQMYDKPQNKRKVTLNCEYAKNDDETTLSFSLDGSGYDNRLRRAVFTTGIFRLENEKGLRVYANVLNKEFEAKWSILTDKSGMRFVTKCMNKKLTLQSTWMTNDILKEWRIDTIYDRKTISLVSTYRPKDKYLCTEVVGLSADPQDACLQLINDENEKSLRLVSQSDGRTAEMKVGWIHNTESKGVILQMNCNRVEVSDFFVGLVTLPEYTGLRVKGIVKGKSVEALLKYKPLKRSFELDLIFQGKLVTFESMLVRENNLQGVQIYMNCETKTFATVFALLHKKPSTNVFKIGGTVKPYGAEYKLALSKSKLEKKLSSMVIFKANSTHYKYGYTISHKSLGTNGQLNHVITTKLHYAKDKILTSIYQFVNSKENINLLSKMELAPGQMLTNKIGYHKQNRILSIKYEMLPGIGMTYLAGFINDDQFMGIESNLTIMDYKPINSFAMLNKRSGLLTCKLTYCPVLPPIEFTSYFSRDDGIDIGFTLSALGQVWNNTILMKSSLKELQLKFDILPDIPILIFAKMFEKKQFVLNVTTCSAFSAELAGTALTDEEYHLVLKHKFLETIFEDLKLSISSLHHLNKLRLRWESKAGKQLLENLNVTMRKLLNRSLENLQTFGESARKLANDTVTYLRSHGQDKLLAAVNTTRDKINFLRKALRNIEMNDTIGKYSTRAAELLKKFKRDVLELVDDMKTYGAPMIDTFNYIRQTVNEISSELSPYTKLFTEDLKQWLSRTVTRYMAVSICGTTIEEIVDLVAEKTQHYYALAKDAMKEQAQLCMRKCREMKSVLNEIQNLTEKAKTTVEDFTCNYNLECTKRNVKKELKKLADRVSHHELKRILERFNKILEQVTLKYKEMKDYVLLTAKENRLQERTMKVLQPIINFLKNVTRTLKMQTLPLREKVEEFLRRSNMMKYYNKMKEQHKELLDALEKAKMYTTNSTAMAKTYLSNKINESKMSLITMKGNLLITYQQFVKLVRKLKDMSWKDLQVLARNEIELNVEKLKEKLVTLNRTIMDRIESSAIAKSIYTTYEDIINGRITAKDAQKRLQVLLKKMIAYLREQKMRAMDKMKALKLEETATKTYKSAIELYHKTKNDLNDKISTLYPKVIEKLNNLVLKIKELAVRYSELAKIKIIELRDKQMVYLKEAMNNLLESRGILMQKGHELLRTYTNYSMEFVENLKMELMKLKERYEQRTKKVIIEYKDKMMNSVEKVKREIHNTLILYQDMPIEEIYLNLQLKASVAFDKLLGFILGETLVPYEKVMERINEIKQFYQRIKRVVETKLKDIKVVVEEFSRKYRVLAVENYAKASEYYRNTIQPTTVEYLLTMKDLGRDIMFASSVKLEQLKLWYEHVRYLKLKELYNKLSDHFAKYNFNLKECCKKKFAILMDIKAKIKNIVNEVRQESKLVIERIEQVNEDVKQDATKTFGPYVKILRDVTLKHKTEALKKLAPVNKKYEKMIMSLQEYYNKTELFLKRRLQEMKDLDQDEITDMLTASFKRFPFLMKVKKYYELVQEANLLQRIYKPLNSFPFLYEVHTHKLWPLLMKEVSDHELVIGIQKLGKISIKKLNELSTDFYTRSLSKIRELRSKTYTGLEQLKDGILAKNEKIKKDIIEKQQEIHQKLRVIHEKLQSKGERLADGARNLYESGNEELQEIIERVGEVSIHDMETAVIQYLRRLMVPVETAYTDLSKFVVAELLILDKYNREMQERLDNLRKYLTSLTADIKSRYEDISTKVNEWGLQAWTIGKSELKKLEKLSIKVMRHLKDYANRSMVLGQKFIDENIPYEDLLKMTPNQLVERLRAIDMEAEKLFKTVKTITKRYIESALRMLQQLKDSVDPEKLKEIKEKAEKFLNNTRDQMDFLATEILETTMFLTKFYGSSDTVYSAHPEMAQFAEYQLQRFLNCSRICKAKAVKFYYEARDIMERLFTQANNTYHNKLPQLMKYIRTEINVLDIANLDKLQNMAIKYLNMSKEYVKAKYNDTLATLIVTKVELLEYLKSKRSELTLELNEAKEKLETFLKNKVRPKANEVYSKLLVVFEELKEMLENKYGKILVYSRKMKEKCRTYMTKYGNTVSDLPVLAKNAMRRLPLILDMMKRDLNTLMNDGVRKLREGKLYIKDEAFPKLKKTYVEIVNAINTQLTQLKETTTNVISSLNEDLKEELPIVKEKVLNIIEVIRKTEVALASGEMEFKVPSLDELKTTLLDLNTLMTTKYGVLRTKIDKLYEVSKNCSKTISQRMRNDAEKTLRYIKEDITNFYQRKITELRDLAQPKLKSLSRSAEMALDELKIMQQEATDFCKEKRLMLSNMTDEARQMVREYVEMLLEKGKDILENMKKQISELRQETKLKVEQLQSKATQMNDDLQQAVSENRKEFVNKIETVLNSIEIKKLINKYIDLEDLRNKTIEIKEDILNISLVKDLVKMGESCYMEGRRLAYLARESSDFALYLIKHIVKHSDVWEIVDELTNPFHWIPPSNSKCCIF